MPSTYLNVRNNNLPDFHVLAPVPLRAQNQRTGYVGMVSRIDSTLARGTWDCSCANSFGPSLWGVKDAANAAVDPGTVQGGAFYSELNCTGAPKGCVDQAALTYNPNVAVGEQMSCVYQGATAPTACTTARVPAGGCRVVPFRQEQ